MLRLMSDLVPALIASRDWAVEDFDLRWYDETLWCVMDQGYRQRRQGSAIEGLDAAAALDPSNIPRPPKFDRRPHHGKRARSRVRTGNRSLKRRRAPTRRSNRSTGRTDFAGANIGTANRNDDTQ